MQGTYEDMGEDEEGGGGHFKAFSGSARTLAGVAGGLSGVAGAVGAGSRARAGEAGWLAGPHPSADGLPPICGPLSTSAGGEAAAPQQQQGARKEKRAIKIVFWANGVFTGTPGC